MTFTPLIALDFAPPLQELVDFWVNAPRKSDPILPDLEYFRPGLLGGLLSHVGHAEYAGPMQLLVNYYGSAIERFSKLNPTQKNYYDLVHDEDLSKALHIYHKTLFAMPVAAFVTEKMILESGSSYLYQTIQLPVLSHGGAKKHILLAGHADHLPTELDKSDRIYKSGQICDTIFIDIGNGTPDWYIKDYQLIM